MRLLSSLTPDHLNHKRVLIRVDYNVPVHEGHILDDTRLKTSLKTIAWLRHNGATVGLLTHFGRPKGIDNSLSTAFLAEPLAALLGEPVTFSDTLTPVNAGVVLYENIRFFPGEEANDPHFAKTLAALGDLYINEGFSVSHRAHASTEGITHYRPSYAGFSVEAEVNALTEGLEAPQRPLVAIVGGAKVSSKITVLEHLLPKVDHLVVGGGMANTFLVAKGYDVGASLYEPDMVSIAADLLNRTNKIIVPLDVVVAPEVTPHIPCEAVSINAVPHDQKILDFGPETVTALKSLVDQAHTVLWNGPLGVFEVPPFHKATYAILHYVAERTQKGALYSICGGGETVAAAKGAGIDDALSFLSTAGGAFLEWLEGKELPGIAALGNNSHDTGGIRHVNVS